LIWSGLHKVNDGRSAAESSSAGASKEVIRGNQTGAGWHLQVNMHVYCARGDQHIGRVYFPRTCQPFANASYALTPHSDVGPVARAGSDKRTVLDDQVEFSHCSCHIKWKSSLSYSLSSAFWGWFAR
jgi:hypothetical protein